MLTKKYLTKNKEDQKVIDQYTDAFQTVQLSDGSYGFCDGLGGVYRAVKVMLPGYDYVYGEATAGPSHTNAHAALARRGSSFPKGKVLVLVDRIK